MAQADRAFKRQVAGLSLPKGVQIASPPYFEGSHFKLRSCLRTGAELARTINKLNTIQGLKRHAYSMEKTPDMPDRPSQAFIEEEVASEPYVQEVLGDFLAMCHHPGSPQS
ncbi:MAG: hypothetical protein U5R49_24795 [Deltaproteobacteria bacterium]|nr:hypothetical protein [Deltaproteobacteria bacterium]